MNYISVDHVGLLVLGLFNASIPAEALKTSFYWDVNQHLWLPKVLKKRKNGAEEHSEDSQATVKMPSLPITLDSCLSFKISSIDVVSDSVAFHGVLI